MNNPPCQVPAYPASRLSTILEHPTRLPTEYIVHYKIRRPDGIIVIVHDDLFVVQFGTNSPDPLVPGDYPAKVRSGNDAHRIVASRRLSEGGAVFIQTISFPDGHFAQQHRLPYRTILISQIRV